MRGGGVLSMLISTALCSRTGLGVAARAAFIICKWFRTCIVQKPGARRPALSRLSPRPPAHRCRRIPLWPSVAPGKNGQETRRPPPPKPRLHRRYIDLKALLPVRRGAAWTLSARALKSPFLSRQIRLAIWAHRCAITFFGGLAHVQHPDPPHSSARSQRVAPPPAPGKL